MGTSRSFGSAEPQDPHTLRGTGGSREADYHLRDEVDAAFNSLEAEVDAISGAGGDNVSVNTTAADDANFSDATPAAPVDGINTRWQKDVSAPDNISSNVPVGAPPQGIGQGNTEGTEAKAARSDHGHKLRETGGPTDLDIAGVPDGTFLKRVGAQIVGAAAAGGDSVSIQGVNATDPNFNKDTPAAPVDGVNVRWQKDTSAPDNASANLPMAAPTKGIGGGNTEGSADAGARADHDHTIRETSGPTDLTVGDIEDTQMLVRSGAVITGADISYPVIGFGNASVGSTTTTRYMDPWWDDRTALTTRMVLILTRPGILRKMYVRHMDNSGNGNQIVYTVNVNEAPGPTPLTVTLATGGTGGRTGSDLVNQMVVAAANRVSVVVTKALSIVASPPVQITMEFI